MQNPDQSPSPGDSNAVQGPTDATAHLPTQPFDGATPTEQLVYNLSYNHARGLVQRAILEADNQKLTDELKDAHEDLLAVSESTQYDPKTGLLTDPAFRERVSEVIRPKPVIPPDQDRRQPSERVEQKPESNAILVLDLDNFGLANAVLSHAGADEEILLPVANILKQLRAGDFASRFGGEEFVVFLANVDKVTAFGIAQRIQDRINELRTTKPVKDRETVGVTIGMAMLENGGNYDKAFKEADERLLQGKRVSHGKNIIMAGDELGAASQA